MCQCCLFLSPGVHVCMSVSLPYYICLYFYFSLSLLLFIPCLFLFQSLSHISVSSHHRSLSPPFSTSPWVFYPLPFPHPSHGRSPSGPGLRQHLNMLGWYTREHRVHCRSSPTPLRYSHIGALWAVCLGRDIRSASTGWAENPSETRHTHLPELTIHQPTPAGNQAGIPARALGEAMLMSWMVSGRGTQFFQLDEHEVVGERWFVVLWCWMERWASII